MDLARQLFTRRTLIKGRPTDVSCLMLDNQTFEVSGGAVKTIRLEQEWYEDVANPANVASALTNEGIADIFTFIQRLPHHEPRYDFYRETETWAVLPISTYEEWWNNNIASRTRSLIRKAQKSGLDVRIAKWDDSFVSGMTAIFNEAPARQGRPFWHYGKSPEQVREQFSRFLSRETLIGAYVGDQLVGFMMLADAGPFALTGQILSLIAYRDKSPNNALIAKAVEVCAARQTPYLVYLNWGSGSFSEFKRRCGFQPVEVPRYYIPLSLKGRLALRLSLHAGFRNLIPSGLLSQAKSIRARWYDWRYS